MAIQNLVWSPDTCRCRFAVSLDDSLPPDQIDFSLVRVLNVGAEHAGLSGLELFAAAHGENRLKNNVLISALALVPGLIWENYRWDYDANRVLRVSFALGDGERGPGTLPTSGQKIALSAQADALSFAGKVVVT